MVVNRKVICAATAEKQLKEIDDHIKNDSLQNAEKVRQSIVTTATKIPEQPTRYPVDKYKRLISFTLLF